MRAHKIRPITFAVFAAVLGSAALASPISAQRTGPLVVDQSSHVVVMEYENWFGPKGVTFQGAAAMPFLQSADMEAVGGGYDSADPAVIQQHVAWLEYLGVDAAIIDLTNGVSCTFNSQWFAEKYLRGCAGALREQFDVIRNNTGNVYPSWTGLGTPLKVIPLLGGSTEDVLTEDIDGKTSFQKEIEYFGALMRRYPNLNVEYDGKPLMLIFLGAAQDPAVNQNPLWFRIEQFLKAHPEISGQYTFREMAGYLDSQSYLWKNPSQPATAPVEINPAYGFWSWVDRLNPTCTVAPSCPYFPSYNVAGTRVENFTASIATAGQSGWGCPNEDSLPYCPDDALRYGAGDAYVTFNSFMNYAAQLDPIFLIIHQFNEFGPPDEGFDANTDDDIEPANLWGDDLSIVQQQIARYRQAVIAARKQ
jgi:hypothetical protein